LKAAAGYFLAELHLKAGEPAKAAEALSALAAAGELPPAYRERAAVMQAAVDVRNGQAARGNAAFAQLAQKHAQEPVMLAETLSACVHAGASCTGAAESARALALTSQAERFRNLHRAVGEQYAAEGQIERALAALETARDKANKNRIDTNDPLLLVRLADLYLAAKSFSENLEIYFELAKEFPAVRQLQEAGQGIYSTEYRSAGDVKIF
jgi:tetratricopeptide (TPR) repeat protein